MPNAFSFEMLAPDAIALGENVRRTVVPAELDDLRESIGELRQMDEGIAGSGLLQPLLVRPRSAANGEPPFQLIYGQKRLLAAQELQLPLVPCLIDGRHDAEIAAAGHAAPQALTRLLQLTENVQRSDPPPLEEAAALRALIDEMGLGLRGTARLLGKSKGYLENRLRLLKMKPDVQRMVAFRKDTLPHAYAIDQVTNATLRAELIGAVMHDEIGVREVRRRIEEFAEKRATPPAVATPASDAASAEAPPTPAELPPGARPNPITRNLRPAVSLLAEAARLFSGATLTPEQQEQVQTELALLRRQIAAIEDATEQG